MLLRDEPDNYLEVPDKLWLEERLAELSKTVMFVSHDRELLSQSAKSIIGIPPPTWPPRYQVIDLQGVAARDSNTHRDSVTLIARRR